MHIVGVFLEAKKYETIDASLLFTICTRVQKL